VPEGDTINDVCTKFVLNHFLDGYYVKILTRDFFFLFQASVSPSSKALLRQKWTSKCFDVVTLLDALT